MNNEPMHTLMFDGLAAHQSTELQTLLDKAKSLISNGSMEHYKLHIVFKSDIRTLSVLNFDESGDAI